MKADLCIKKVATKQNKIQIHYRIDFCTIQFNFSYLLKTCQEFPSHYLRENFFNFSFIIDIMDARAPSKCTLFF